MRIGRANAPKINEARTKPLVLVGLPPACNGLYILIIRFLFSLVAGGLRLIGLMFTSSYNEAVGRLQVCETTSAAEEANGPIDYRLCGWVRRANVGNLAASPKTWDFKVAFMRLIRVCFPTFHSRLTWS